VAYYEGETLKEKDRGTIARRRTALQAEAARVLEGILD
jgi:hypothetical protein